ncbi:ADQ_G0034290.mRNA.1.CDS.1 [Saccharomyces cerevisiae]|nr:ADQ_G0034290.mRNA.1.CDS.1 [Saccharomyces cerevisiae]CAI6783080.1 ADQ_G0034290.mRNA.1.CDS.1 [Saccharomyces cerevisiae]
MRKLLLDWETVIRKVFKWYSELTLVLSTRLALVLVIRATIGEDHIHHTIHHQHVTVSNTERKRYSE